MKVLFIGNSHTYFNDMPELFARMVEKTVGDKPQTVMLAFSGRELDWHRNEYFSLRFNLMYGGYDYCVFQQAAHPYPPVEATLRDGREIAALCQRHGTRPVVFMTWAEKLAPENQQIMIDTCEKLAEESGALLAPIGRIWKELRRREPEIDLYFEDGAHAGTYGDFLIAATLCRTVAGSVSPDVCGQGIDFYSQVPEEGEFPRFCEDAETIRVPLDAGKTRAILRAVEEAFA